MPFAYTAGPLRLLLSSTVLHHHGVYQQPISHLSQILQAGNAMQPHCNPTYGSFMCAAMSVEAQVWCYSFKWCKYLIS